MTATQAVRHDLELPDVLKSMSGVHTKLEALGLDRTLHHLVLLRASQINRCGYCVELHTKEARRDGETDERLDRIVVWDQVSVFTDREKAALAWTEALTTLPISAKLGGMRARLREHFSEREISILTATIAMINLWNRIGISGH